jgi:hypothetical protein
VPISFSKIRNLRRFSFWCKPESDRRPPNEKQFLEKHKDKSPEEVTAEFEKKTEELKALKKEFSDAAAEWYAKEKEFKKKEKKAPAAKETSQ